jgi:hypothetical protein
MRRQMMTLPLISPGPLRASRAGFKRSEWWFVVRYLEAAPSPSGRFSRARGSNDVGSRDKVRNEK